MIFTVTTIDSQTLTIQQHMANAEPRTALKKMPKHHLTIKKIAGFGLLPLAIFTGVLTGLFVFFTRDLPQIRSLESFKPSAITRIYSSEHMLLDTLFIEKRDAVPLRKIPYYLKAALVATEDRNFYKHSGVDIKGIVRAILKDIRAGGFVQGASTITQQLTKTLFLTPEKSLVRKIKEAILAFQLERRYTKDEILELYLNQVYFGSGAYGVESAARIYFDTPVEKLSLNQCAMIAGMPKAPSRYSPFVNYDLAFQRRNTVLKQMITTAIISRKQYESARKSPITISKRLRELPVAPYFVGYIKQFLEKELGPSRLYKEGFSIYTTLSFELQKTANQAVQNGFGALEKRMQQKGKINPHPQMALVALDVETGGILSMTGGKNYAVSPFNRATNALRQPGSAFKPIVYAHAVERGFSQNKTILDAPIVFKTMGSKKEWQPENFSKTYKGEMTLRKALALSQNIPAVRLIEILGPSSVADFAHTLGIESRMGPNLSLALGTSEVNLMELTAAYAVFANMGKAVRPYGVLEVIDRAGRSIWKARPQPRVAMSRAGAAIMVDMLKGVVLEGTGRKARFLSPAVAGKTGTTNGYKDALFVGFSPSIATGVWCGVDNSATLGRNETGARAALPVWINFMEKAIATAPGKYFDIPDDVVRLSFDLNSGRMVSGNHPGAVTALFRRDETAPKQ
jgi:penicillin-binding protein 1A